MRTTDTQLQAERGRPARSRSQLGPRVGRRFQLRARGGRASSGAASGSAAPPLQLRRERGDKGGCCSPHGALSPRGTEAGGAAGGPAPPRAPRGQRRLLPGAGPPPRALRPRALGHPRGAHGRAPPPSAPHPAAVTWKTDPNQRRDRDRGGGRTRPRGPAPGSRPLAAVTRGRGQPGTQARSRRVSAGRRGSRPDWRQRSRGGAEGAGRGARWPPGMPRGTASACGRCRRRRRPEVG